MVHHFARIKQVRAVQLVLLCCMKWPQQQQKKKEWQSPSYLHISSLIQTPNKIMYTTSIQNTHTQNISSQITVKIFKAHILQMLSTFLFYFFTFFNIIWKWKAKNSQRKCESKRFACEMFAFTWANGISLLIYLSDTEYFAPKNADLS